MKIKYVADFETTPFEQYKVDGFTKVWLYYIENIYDEKDNNLGMDIADMFNFLINNKQKFVDRNKKVTYDIYFHNLRFDAQFILQYLTSNNYKFHYEDRKLKSGQMSTLISDKNVYYAINVKISSRITVKFYDSYKLLPVSVARLPNSRKEVFAKNYDYSKFRYEKDLFEVSDEDKIYIRNDVKIVIENLKKLFDNNLTKMTTASNAMHFYKNLDSDKYKKLFPQLDKKLLDVLRNAYSGGFTYLNNNYKDVLITDNVVSYDVNSLFPYVMRYKPLPYGNPLIWKKGMPLDKKYDEYPLRVYHIKIYKGVLKDGYHPFFGKSSRYVVSSSKSYAKYIKDERVYLSNIDLEQLEKYYDLDYDIVAFSAFKQKIGIFNTYVDYWFKKKINATNEFDKFLAKLYLNTLYGKFGTNYTIQSLQLGEFNEKKEKYEKEIVSSESRNKFYLPMGIFITSYARAVTIEGMQLNAERFIYSDTDSIHLIGDDLPKGIELDEKMLGAWKNEGLSTKSKWVGNKQYLKFIDNKINRTVAGVSKDMQKMLNFENFYIGYVFQNAKLAMTVVKGGCVLKPIRVTFR